MFLNYNPTTSNVYDNGLIKLFGKRKLKFSSLFSQVIISRNCMCSFFFTWEQLIFRGKKSIFLVNFGHYILEFETDL